jgi:hypothetical protein
MGEPMDSRSGSSTAAHNVSRLLVAAVSGWFAIPSRTAVSEWVNSASVKNLDCMWPPVDRSAASNYCMPASR